MPLRPDGSHPFGRVGRDAALDATLTLTLFMIGQYSAWVGDVFPGPRWANAAMVAAMSLSLWWRRRYPMAVLVVVVGTAAAQSLLYGSTETAAVLLPFLVAAYSAAAFGGPLYVVVVVVALGLAVVNANDPLVTSVGQAIWAPTVFGVVLVLGFLSGHRRRLASAASARAEALERDRDHDLAQAVVGERARIARELHDMVAHGVSLMALHAGAAQASLDRDPQRARESLNVIRETGNEVVLEMGRLVGLLRSDDDPGTAPLPSLDSLGRLVDGVAAAGLAVDLSVEGEPIPLDPGVEVAIYRIVQEALTNALKHSTAGSADVMLRWHTRSIEVVVENPAELDPPGATSGKGLIGVDERVQFVHGTWHAGPTPTGRWRLEAELPARISEGLRSEVSP